MSNLNMIFVDRQDAGKKLAVALEKYKNEKGVVVIALPRGGVIVASEIAKALRVPLDIIVPRKIGAPQNPELALGAITEDGQGVWNEELIKILGVTKDYLDETIKKEQKEARRRLQVYRGNKPALNLKNKTVIVVDDGIATGATMHAALNYVRKKNPKKNILAAPVTAPDTVRGLQKNVEEMVILDTPEFFSAVGQFYQNFPQNTDEEVIKILRDVHF